MPIKALTHPLTHIKIWVPTTVATCDIFLVYRSEIIHIQVVLAGLGILFFFWTVALIHKKIASPLSNYYVRCWAIFIHHNFLYLKKMLWMDSLLLVKIYFGQCRGKPCLSLIQNWLNILIWQGLQNHPFFFRIQP